MRGLLALFAFAAPVAAWSQSAPALLPSNEVAIEQLANRPRVIVPGVMVYGVPWTATMDDFRRQFGPPTGVFSIRDDSVAWVYGRQHVLIFEKGALREVALDLRLFNYALEPHVLPHPFFDSGAAVVEPGIRLGSTSDELEKLLPGKLAIERRPGGRGTIMTEYAAITLWFAMRRGAPGDPNFEARTVMSISIRGH